MAEGRTGRGSRLADGVTGMTRRACPSEALAGSRTDLPVLLPVRPPQARAGGELWLPRLNAWHGAVLATLLVLSVVAAEAQTAYAPEVLSIPATLIKWTPLLLQGFGLNIAMSFLAMAIGTIAGTFLGIAQVSLLRSVRRGAWLVTQFFRNAPWLVLLFYVMLLVPFELQLGGTTVPLPDWAKATFGFSLPVMANVSEIVRGAILSVPATQWESAEALAFNRRQILWSIILPQCVKRMLPPWMNLYAILTMATVLASVVGVNEALTLTGDALAAEDRGILLVPMYLWILSWFFLYCYPIARLTIHLERRFMVQL